MRKAYIDNIKWITVVLVVIYHVFYMFNANGVLGGPGHFYDYQPWDAVQYMLYPWFMSLLFVVAGINAKTNLETHSEKVFIRNRTVKLLVPSTIGLFVFQWIQGWLNMLNSGMAAQLRFMPFPVRYALLVLSGTGVLWFLQVLWFLSVLLILIRRIEKGKLERMCEKFKIWMLVPMGILFWASAQVLNTPIIVCYKFGIYSFSYFMGYYIFSQNRVIEVLQRGAIGLIIAAVTLGISFTLRYFNTNYADVPVFNSVLSMAFAYIAILAILGGMSRFCDHHNAFTLWMTRKSWGLYVFHYIGIAGAGHWFYTKSGLPAAGIYILTGISAFVIGYVLYEIICRIPVLRWCVLGIRKEK